MQIIFFIIGIILLALYVAFLVRLWGMTKDVNEIMNYLAVNQAQMIEINKTLKEIKAKKQ